MTTPNLVINDTINFHQSHGLEVARWTGLRLIWSEQVRRAHTALLTVPRTWWVWLHHAFRV